LRQAALDETVDRTGHLTEQPGDVVVPRRRQRMSKAWGETRTRLVSL
jgi:hypothetical protein